MAPLLEATGIHAGYGDTEILHGVDISVAQDEIVTIIGPNGCGKSTLMKTIVGTVRAARGEIRFDGEAVERLRADQRIPRGLCFVPQTENVFPSLTVLENLQMGGFLRGGSLQQRIEEMFELFPDLAERRTAKAGVLSGGQRQMVAFARAMMLEPKLLLLDEPSAGLSPLLVDVVFQKIIEINKAGVAILIVEQNALKSLRLSHRGYVLAMGEVQLEDTGQQLADDPQVGRLYLGGDWKEA